MRKNLLIFILMSSTICAAGFFLIRGNGGENNLIHFFPVSLPEDASNTSTSDAQDIEPPPAVPVSTPQTFQATTDMRGYQNLTFHFGLLFPKELKATEYKENGGALTASFQDPSTNEGFEVYVTPYNGQQIDTARFKLDEPSGVYEEPKDVVVDGVRATMFYGKNAIMGDTREVWFIHNGFLYEVTTYKELDSWLAGIMQTWKFI